MLISITHRAVGAATSNGSPFFAAGGSADGRRDRVHISGMWLPCPRLEAPRCPNGEVWTSPCRESPRLLLAPRWRGRGTSTAKADAVYQIMLEESGPPCGAALAGGPGLGALPGHTDPRTCECPGSGPRWQGGPDCKGPPVLMSPHQTGLTTTAGSTKERRKTALLLGRTAKHHHNGSQGGP